MTTGNIVVTYLLIRERERELAHDGEVGRLSRDYRYATEGRRPGPDRRPTPSWPFGLGRLTRRAATGGA